MLAEYPVFRGRPLWYPRAAFSVEDLDPIERHYYERLGAQQYTCYLDRIHTFDDTDARTLLGLVFTGDRCGLPPPPTEFLLGDRLSGAATVPSISEILANEVSRLPGPIRRHSFHGIRSHRRVLHRAPARTDRRYKGRSDRGDPNGQRGQGHLVGGRAGSESGQVKIGVAPLRLEFANRPAVDVMVKSKPLDSEITTTLAAVMSMAGGGISQAHG